MHSSRISGRGTLGQSIHSSHAVRTNRSQARTAITSNG